MPWARHVYHVYTLRVGDRDKLQKTLQVAGIQTAIHYAIPAHLQPAYSDLAHGKGSFPHSEQAAEEVLALPIYPELSEQALTHVADTVKKTAVRTTQSLV